MSEMENLIEPYEAGAIVEDSDKLYLCGYTDCKEEHGTLL